jgi:hypothetical protein
MHPGTIPRDVLQWSTREPKDSPATRIIGVKSVAALKPLTADNAPCYLDSSDTEVRYLQLTVSVRRPRLLLSDESR